MQVKTYYELLDVLPTASADEIKRAFRREIAKYHPDKVQHLGREFQEIAVAKAADLTQAYQTLTDAAERAEYDARQQAQSHAPPLHATISQPVDAPAVEPPDSSSHQVGSGPSGHTDSPSSFAQERAGATDLVRRATVMRFRQVLEHEFGRYEAPAVRGFEVTCVPGGGFWTIKLPPRVLGRFVPVLDATAVSETWRLACGTRKDVDRDVCVFLMAPSVAPAAELASAIADQRRKPMPAGGKLILVPVNTRTWQAFVPTEAPPVVRSLVTRLQSS